MSRDHLHGVRERAERLARSASPLEQLRLTATAGDESPAMAGR
jgi:hypothetical protein